MRGTVSALVRRALVAAVAVSLFAAVAVSLFAAVAVSLFAAVAVSPFGAATPAAAQSRSGPLGADPQRVKQLREDAARAAAELEKVRPKLDAAVAAYEAARTDLQDSARRLREAEGRLRRADAEVRTARDVLGRRASTIYRHGRVYLLEALLEAPSLNAFVRTVSLAGRVVRQDGDAVRRMEAALTQATGVREQMRAEQERARERAEHVDALRAEVAFEMRRAADLLEKARGDLKQELGKFRFPVLPPYSYVDSFGAPRMEGTKYAHAHEGTDIFAPSGTPVVAVVGGTVFGVGQAVLGGNKLWLRGPDGHTYYYAHLAGFAEAARDGTQVDPGTTLGYVGDTGNARGTPPHLHFEVHDPGGRALNPYPILRDAEVRWAPA